jgi:hypothetical protein
MRLDIVLTRRSLYGVAEAAADAPGDGTGARKISRARRAKMKRLAARLRATADQRVMNIMWM